MDFQNMTTVDLLKTLHELFDIDPAGSNDIIETLLSELRSRPDAPPVPCVNVDAEWRSFVQYIRMQEYENTDA